MRLPNLVTKPIQSLKIVAGVCALAVFASTLAPVFTAHAANGADFRAGNIIDDGTFTNKNSMSIEAIQNFLNQKVPWCDLNGEKTIYDSTHGDTVSRRVFSERRGISAPFTCLRHYNEGGKSAAQIIWEKSQDFSINPQVLIVLLQKEQALVTDEWPWPIQYRNATGYGCPDTAPCDAQYYGFTNQVYQAAKMFRRIMDGGGFNYYPVGVNNILYNPNQDCGRGQVTILNRATSALYNYTPYQPNGAALNNINGMGDGCSAYGNRNFWRDFTDWFGPSNNNGFVLARSSEQSDLRQWVVYNNIKQLVPSPEIIEAWGLQNTPLITYDKAALNGIATGPALGRLMRANNSNTQYLVDKGKRYSIASAEMLDAWNLRGATLSTVSTGLATVPADGGPLTYGVRKEGTDGIYRVSGVASGNVVLNAYPSPQMLLAWEGDNPKHNVVSENLFSSLDNAVGPVVSSAKISYNNVQYMVNNGKRLKLDADTANLYPGSAQTVLSGTFNRLPYNGMASPFIRQEGTSGVFLVDKTGKRPFANPYVLQAWAANRAPLVNIVNQSYFEMVPTISGQISKYLARSSDDGRLYLLDGRKLAVPGHLETPHGSAGVVTVSNDVLDTLATSQEASLFMKAKGSPGVYLLENGIRRAFTNPTDFSLWTNGGNYYIELNPDVVESFPRGQDMSSYVTLDSTNFLIDGNKRHVVGAAMANGLALPAPVPITMHTLGRMAEGSAFSDAKLKVGDTYYLLSGGKGWHTTNSSLASLWQVSNAPAASGILLGKLTGREELRRFVRSTDPADNRILTVDNGKLYALANPAMVWSLGYQGEPISSIRPGEIAARVQNAVWYLPLAKKSDGTLYVIDKGSKRAFSDAEARNQWTNNGAIPVITVSDTLLSGFGSGGALGKSVKGSGSTIYKVVNGQKQPLQSQATYAQNYAPYAQVSDTLLETLPTGPSIP